MSYIDPVSHMCTNMEHVFQSAASRVSPEKLEICDQYTRCLTGFPHPLGNLVIDHSSNESDYLMLLDELEAWSTANNAPVAIGNFPGAGHSDRTEWATGRNWLNIDNMPGMWMEIPEDFSVGSLYPGAEVKLADDADGLVAVTRVVAKGYPLDESVADFFMRGIHEAGLQNGGMLANILVTVEGEPAACSSVCVKDGAAGVYCVATLERFRRRGLGAAVTRAAMLQGKQLGAKHALLHASEMGDPVYRKIGFAEHCRIPLFAFGLSVE